MYHRRRRFGQGAVLQSTMTAKRKAKCRGCNNTFEKGETVVRLRLRKSFRQPCATCGHKLLGVRWYHTGCVPANIEKAMGWDPNAQRAAATPPPPVNKGGAVPPPPKPQSAADAQLGALLSIENALKRRLAESPALQNDPQLAKTLATYNSCKAHALRNANDNEARLGLKNALKRALDLVY